MDDDRPTFAEIRQLEQEEKTKFEKQEEALLFLLEKSERIQRSICQMIYGERKASHFFTYTRDEICERLMHVKPHMYKKKPIAFPAKDVYNQFPEITGRETMMVLRKHGFLLRNDTVPLVFGDKDKAVRCLIIDIYNV